MPVDMVGAFFSSVPAGRDTGEEQRAVQGCVLVGVPADRPDRGVADIGAPECGPAAVDKVSEVAAVQA
jgi:hypothetical protein